MRLVQSSLLLLAWLFATFALAAPQSQRFEVDGVRLHYLSIGEGTPVVLVHGYTSSAASWVNNGIAALLAQHYRVLVLDARGHGESDKPHDPKAYGAQMAADVIALLDHEGIEQAHLGGYSMGGLLTLKAITMAPDRFLSAVIGGQGWTGNDVGLGEGLTEEIAVALENGRGIEPLIHALNPEGAPPVPEAQIEAMAKFIETQNDPLALAAVIRSTAGWLPDRAAIAQNPVPSIAVVGDRDPLISAARNLAGNLANFQRLEVLVGATHGGVVRDPAYAARFGEAMLRFLASVEAAEDASSSSD